MHVTQRKIATSVDEFASQSKYPLLRLTTLFRARPLQDKHIDEFCESFKQYAHVMGGYGVSLFITRLRNNRESMKGLKPTLDAGFVHLRNLQEMYASDLPYYEEFPDFDLGRTVTMAMDLVQLYPTRANFILKALPLTIAVQHVEYRFNQRVMGAGTSIYSDDDQAMCFATGLATVVAKILSEKPGSPSFNERCVSFPHSRGLFRGVAYRMTNPQGTLRSTLLERASHGLRMTSPGIAQPSSWSINIKTFYGEQELGDGPRRELYKVLRGMHENKDNMEAVLNALQIYTWGYDVDEPRFADNKHPDLENLRRFTGEVRTLMNSDVWRRGNARAIDDLAL